MPKRVLTGVVTSDKAAKTRRVEVTRLVRHARYSKIQRRRTICIAHDEGNVSHAGDVVEVEESRPMSKTKRWVVLRVVGQGQGAEEAAKRALAHTEVNPADELPPEASAPAGSATKESVAKEPTAAGTTPESK